VTSRGRSVIPAKDRLLHLLKAHSGSRITPLLYMNVIGQPALLPASAFDAISGYVERRYSGEHVDLWGRMILGGHIGDISLIRAALYHYFSRPDGNYRRDALQHRLGVAAALMQLARIYFDDHSEYSWAASGRGLPSLYAPVARGGRHLTPSWARVQGEHWSLTTEISEASMPDGTSALNLNLHAEERSCEQPQRAIP